MPWKSRNAFVRSPRLSTALPSCSMKPISRAATLGERRIEGDFTINIGMGSLQPRRFRPCALALSRESLPRSRERGTTMANVRHGIAIGTVALKEAQLC